MPIELSVYLDHLIGRENLRYQRPSDPIERDDQHQPYLRLKDLYAEDSEAPLVKYIKKPDFQRATWSWSPQQCASLIESLVNEQVIPSLIMWSNPENGLDYVLDGGHRISAILAWFTDNWGDKSIPEQMNEAQKSEITRAANQVRALIRANVGQFMDYRKAGDKFDEIVENGDAPRIVLSPNEFKQARFYQKLVKGSIGMHILWVKGDYEKAEQSFLNINKGGRELTPWETAIVEYRNSSFARSVMSIANLHSIDHYWPNDDGYFAEDVEQIKQYIYRIEESLFKPQYSPPVTTLRQALLPPPSIQTEPLYIAEFLTVVEGGRGNNAEYQSLMAKGKDDSPDKIIRSAEALLGNAERALSHLIGDSSRAIGIVPLLYFYSDEGRHVRGLFYGFIYWLLSGSNEDVLNRKRLLCAYRADYERLLRKNKSDIIQQVSRNIGSGPEVTMQSAHFFDQLLQIVTKKGKSEWEPDRLDEEYLRITQEFGKPKSRQSASRKEVEVTGRNFTSRQKSTILIKELLDRAIICGICGGLLDPTTGAQHDHIVEVRQHGATSTDNQRVTHPFCNHQRQYIEKIQRQGGVVPTFTTTDLETRARQLGFPELPELLQGLTD